MSKIGSYYLPDILVSQAIDITKTIYDNQIGSDEALATKLGHKTTNSGGFIKKLVTLRQLGIIKSGIRAIELTQLGTKIARPVGGEEKQARKELMSRFPLFIELKKKLKSKTPDRDGVLIALIDIVKVDRATLDREVSRIQNIYIDAEKCFPSVSDDSISDTGGFEMETPTSNSSSQILEIKSGNLYMRLPQNLEAIEEAKFILNAREEMLKKKLSKK